MALSLRLRAALAVALATPLAAACGTDDLDAHLAVFSSADAAHLRRTLGALAAGDLTDLYLLGIEKAGDGQNFCPVTVTSGDVTTVHGGCDRGGTDPVVGTLIVTNVDNGLGGGFDPTRPSTVVADGFGITIADGFNSVDKTFFFDGDVSLVYSPGDPTRGATFTGLLDAVTDGIESRSDLRLACDPAGACTVTAGGRVTVDGVGTAAVTGTIGLGQPRTGLVTAVGAETLVLDLAASAAPCFRFTIDGGPPQTLCEPDDGP